MKTRLTLILMLSLGVGIWIPLFLGGGDATLRLLSNLSPMTTASLTTLVVITWLANASRIFLLFKRHGTGLSFGGALALTLACDFSTKVTPAGIGGPITAITLLRKTSIRPATTIAAFSLLLALDCLLILGLSLITYAISPKQWIQQGPLLNPATLGSVFIFVLVGLVKAPRYYRKIVIVLSRLLLKFPASRRLSYPLKRQFITVEHGWRTFLSLPMATRLLIAVSSTVFWLTQFSILHACLVLLGANISWAVAAAVQFLAMGAGRLTMLPAGSGGLEAVATGLLLIWIDPATAAAGVLLWRSATLFPCIVAGGMTMLALGVKLSPTKSALPKKQGSYTY